MPISSTIGIPQVRNFVWSANPPNILGTLDYIHSANKKQDRLSELACTSAFDVLEFDHES